MKTESNHYIITTGTNGRCVLFGRADSRPVVGQPYTLTNARMIIRWTRQGLLGLAANGPLGDDRISATVPVTSGGAVQQVIDVPQAAADAIAGAPEWIG